MSTHKNLTSADIASIKATLHYLIDRLYGHMLSAEEVKYLRELLERGK